MAVIVVIDGMGGGIGAQLVARLRKELGPTAEIFALATNAVAVQHMVDAGATRGASGENSFRVMLQCADFILGPLGVALPDSMMGELTPAMAEAVLCSRAKKILLPLSQQHLSLVGLAQKNLAELIDEAAAALKAELRPL